MHRLIIWVQFFVVLHLAALAVRAERLEAVWIGPGGAGGEGDWNTPSHWNLGVVPDNGIDADGDGVPDIFDVRIDNLPGTSSVVRSDEPPVVIAGLTVDEGDILELKGRFGFLLRDSDSVVDLVNNGLIRVGSAGAIEQWMSFAGEALHLRGNGVIQLGMSPGRRAILAATDGGRIFNGPNHTLQSSGVLHAGRILGPSVSDSDVALTNEGTILATDRSNLGIHLNSETHYNDGTMRATGNADLSVTAVGGRLWNRGLITADDESQFTFRGKVFFNDTNGVVRASGGTVRFMPPTENGIVSNAGLIEAIDGGTISIEGEDIFNHRNGIVRASSGGVISLWEGTFRLANQYQILDEHSMLQIAYSVYENQGNLLSAGPGTLSLFDAHIIGGHLSSGLGRLKIDGATLEDVAVSGTVMRGAVHSRVDLRLKGVLNVFSDFTVLDNAEISVDGASATIRGDGLSKFQAVSLEARSSTLEIANGHWAEFASLQIDSGELKNNGVIVANTYSGFRLYNGTLSGNGAVVSPQIQIDGLISPGDGIGILTLVGDVSFNRGQFGAGAYQAELGMTDSDLLAITGDLNISTEFDSLLLSGGLIDESYVIARYSGERTGIFDTVTPGYNVIYDDLAKQIRVEPIPEPASVALVVVGMLVVGLWRLRKRGRCGA